MNKVILDGQDISLNDFINVARNNYSVELGEHAKKRIIASRKIVDDIVKDGKVVYGITTGFGKFSNVTITKDQCRDLQKNLILSHSCGVGNYLPKEVVRGIMFLRANALSRGFSGITIETLEFLISMLNKNIHPCIPEKGSLGASGDLAPLAHMVLPILGEGTVEFNGEIMDSINALNFCNLKKRELTFKEGLALINGTQVMTSIGALAVFDSLRLLKMSDCVAALTVEALRGIKDAYDPRVQNVRGHLGQISTAKNLLNLLEGSSYVTTQGDLRVQDAYTLRCIPQVHGAVKDSVNYVKEKIEIEMNAVTDNPIIFENGDVISGGNFHGEPVAIPFDFLAIAISELGNISERRLERLVNSQLNDLPPFLTENGGVNSGFMITQYVSAALVSENKILAHPASVDSIPSSANQEDHVSMGTIAARKARDVILNTTRVLANEMFAACQGIDFRENLDLGSGTKVLYDLVRKDVNFIKNDKKMYIEMNKCFEILQNDDIINKIEYKVNLSY